MIEATEHAIRTAPCPTCAVCGEGGVLIHSELRDHIFGAPGTWDLKRCINPQCLLIWLDPMPLGDDIGKAYARYYTHASADPARRRGRLRRTLRAWKRTYLTVTYGYPSRSRSLLISIGAPLLRAFPFWRADADGAVRFLRHVPQGRLLDVGCGSGDWLLSMRDLGWDVVGLDFDPDAVAVGRLKGLTITCGALEQQFFASHSFDAITLNHVIEHLPDPIGTLTECARILKPGGTLVIFTPNGPSLGHRIFTQHWRGLEPPRHLHIFARPSLHRALARAGFQDITLRPWLAPSIIYESYLLRRGWPGPCATVPPPWRARPIAGFLILIELLLLRWKPALADCVAAIAVKS